MTDAQITVHSFQTMIALALLLAAAAVWWWIAQRDDE
jgi:hypothetical protein